MTTPEREPLLSEARIAELADTVSTDFRHRLIAKDAIRQACRETAEQCAKDLQFVRDVLHGTQAEHYVVELPDTSLGEWLDAAIRAKVGRE